MFHFWEEDPFEISGAAVLGALQVAKLPCDKSSSLGKSFLGCLMLQESMSEQNNTSKMWHGSTNQQQRSHTRSYAVYVYNSLLPFLEQKFYCTPEFQNPGAVNYFQSYFGYSFLSVFWSRFIVHGRNQKWLKNWTKQEWRISTNTNFSMCLFVCFFEGLEAFKQKSIKVKSIDHNTNTSTSIRGKVLDVNYVEHRGRRRYFWCLR